MTHGAEAGIELVDPRPYGTGANDALVARAMDAASGQGAPRSSLVAELRGRLKDGDDASIAAGFAAAPNQRIRLYLIDALKSAIDDPDFDDDVGLITRVFAIPTLFVTGGRPGAVVPGMLPDAAAVSALLLQHGALGQTENFGIGAALATGESLDALEPSLIFRWTRSIGDDAPMERKVSGEDIVTDGTEEEVHLRFMVGAGIAPAQGLSFVESASRIGAWGVPVTRELAAQLGQEGLSLLPLPRPPRSLVLAVPAGSFALQETSLNLFASKLLRRLRSSVGEPVAVISAHAGGELRIAFSSVFDERLREGFRWRLGPFDDMNEVLSSVLALLRDCRVLDVRVVAGLQPDRDATGTPRFLSVHDLGPSGEVRP
jgi:hypothetical protein